MNERTNYLTSIRGFACLIVFIAHLISTIPEIGIYVSGCGKIGVWLFFILSALLLTLQWNKEENINITNIIKFYIKRIFRIYPCYIIVLILAFFIGYIDNITTILKHLFLLEGFGHLWTIPVEFVFYLILPFLIILIKKFKKTKYQIIFLFTILIISEILFPYFLYEENSINIKWYIPVFIMGILLSYSFKYFEKKNLSSIFFDIICLVVLLFMLFSTPYFRQILFNIKPDSYLQNKYLYFGIGWCIILVSIQNSKYIIKYLNKSKTLIKLGNISFPLYLVHYIILNLLTIDNILLYFLSVFVISIFLSVILNKFIEIPMIKISKNILQIIEKTNYNN